MDDKQAMAQQSDADEQNDATLTTPTGDNFATTDASTDEATDNSAEASSDAASTVQPNLTYPDGGTAGEEPVIATATSGSELPESTAEESQPDVAEAAAGDVPQEQDWRPADAAQSAAQSSSQDDQAGQASDASSPAAASSTGGETMEELMQMYGQQSFRTLKYGEVIEGRIMRVGKDELLVDIGAKSEGIVPSNELSDLSPEEFAEMQPGDEILVSVVNTEDSEGHAVLSLNRARQEKSWRKLQKQFEGGEIIATDVSGFNKGGLLVNLEGVRGFVPSSQVSGLGGSEQAKQADLQNMVGRPISLKIIEINRNRNRLILSERLAVTAQREVMKERLLSELKSGDVRHGRVVSIADFGAFVDIGGADGLIHLSELSWSRVNHPSEVLKVGQEVDVYVLGVDEADRKIALSLKRTQVEPWTDITARYQVGQLVEGTITQLATFGAFARVADGVEGLIHVSELSEGRILHPRDVVKEGDKLTLRIIRIDPQRKRIGLSLKRAVEGASMDDIIAEPGEGGQRAPRGERSGGERAGGSGEARPASGGGERAARPERTGGESRTERFEQRGERRDDRRNDRRDDRRQRDQSPMQTTFGGGGGESAMEIAMREAMARNTGSEEGEGEEQNVPRSAMNTVDVTIDTNTPAEPMTHVGEAALADANEIEAQTAPDVEETASAVAATLSSAASDDSDSGTAQASTASESSNASASEAETPSVADVVSSPAQHQSSIATESSTTTAESNAATSQQAEDTSVATSSASSDTANLEWVHGIGPTYNKRLAEAGISSNEDLASATPERLREIGFDHESDEELQNWIQQAKDKLGS